MLQINDDQYKYLKIFLSRYKEIRPILIDIIYESAKTTPDHSRFRGKQDIIDLFDEVVKDK